MTIRVSVAHREAYPARPIVAQVFDVDARGQLIGDGPVRTQVVPPGVSATVHLHPGNMLLVREEPQDAPK